MNPLLLGPIADIFTNLIGLGKELVVDKDKQVEYAYKVAQLQTELVGKMLTMQTTPKTDSAVKLIFAVKEFIIPLFRPLISAAITGFGIYAHYKGIQIPEYIHVILDSAFPGWMTSRHISKKNAQET